MTPGDGVLTAEERATSYGQLIALCDAYHRSDNDGYNEIVATIADEREMAALLVAAVGSVTFMSDLRARKLKITWDAYVDEQRRLLACLLASPQSG